MGSLYSPGPCLLGIQGDFCGVTPIGGHSLIRHYVGILKKSWEWIGTLAQTAPWEPPHAFSGRFGRSKVSCAKQIQIVEKSIKDWRWKALRANIDVAQLRAAYVEYLWPKLESVLLYATVPKKICNSWMSTILKTFGKRGGMSTARTLNRYAFCVLADIPHIWLRTQTARATELMVYLNSCNSIVGRSTRARFCALFKTSDPAIATRRLEPKRKLTRVTPSACVRHCNI